MVATAFVFCLFEEVPEVSESIKIGRPPATVQSQFGDVGYHQRSGHHRGVLLTVLEDTAQSCRYEQLTKVGPIRVRQCFVLDRGDLVHHENELVSGAFAPGAIEFVIEGNDDESTVVATLRTEPRGLTRLVQPLLRPILRRSLKVALREDRDDLESGRYERSTSAVSQSATSRTRHSPIDPPSR